MNCLNRAKQGAVALSLILLAGLAPLACGTEETGPGEAPGADVGDPAADAGWGEDAAGVLPGADASEPGLALLSHFKLQIKLPPV